MAFTCDYNQRKRKHEIQNAKREIELDEEYAQRERKKRSGERR